MVLPAKAYMANPRETIAHDRTVAAATDSPIAVDITPEVFAEPADEPRFVAIEESSENVRRIADLVNTCGDRTQFGLAQSIELAAQECGFGSERVRAPRLPLVGEECERILSLVWRAITTRPQVEAYA